MTAPSGQSGQFLQRNLLNGRQTVSLLRSQIQAGRVDQNYFLQRLDSLNQLFDDLLTERQQRADASRFAKLYEVSRAIGSSLDLEVVLNQVMDAIITLTGAERGFLMLLNDDGVLDVQIARDFDQESLGSDEVVVSRTITRQVFESSQPVVTTNAAEDPRFAGQASIVANKLRSIMAAPLRARGSTIGVIYVDNSVKTGLFQEQDLELLEAFAGQAGVSIDNARLFRETDEQLAQRVEELKTLQWIDRQLNETLDVSKAMQITTDWALRVCEAQSASLAMLNADDDSLEMMSHSGERVDVTHTRQDISSVHPLLLQVLEKGEAAIQNAPEGGDDPQSILCVPIRRENNTVGIIIVTADRENAFGSEAQALITRMADRAAIAIENSRLYNEVTRANQAKSEFVGIVAHELKAPMTGISGYSELILQFGNLPERETGYIERIRGAVQRMQQLVDDLSDISRIESGNLRVEVTEVDLAEVIEQAKASVSTQADEREHNIIEKVDSKLPKVEADPARTVQIVTNLLSNAVKYTPNGGKITLTTKLKDGMVLLSVKDTGVGMSEDELNNLGTKFWRSSNEHSVKQRGTGLGFSITRNLIETMGGTLEIQSNPGKGSTFTVGLPVSGSA